MAKAKLEVSKKRTGTILIDKDILDSVAILAIKKRTSRKQIVESVLKKYLQDIQDEDINSVINNNV